MTLSLGNSSKRYSHLVRVRESDEERRTAIATVLRFEDRWHVEVGFPTVVLARSS